MRLYPAIDIKNGQCVRLKQGLFTDINVYSNEPHEVAAEFERTGAKFIHLVDLDGALLGAGANDSVIKKILSHIHIPAEVGGGIRSAEDVARKLDMGVRRVIIGTKAVESPGLVKEMIQRFGADKIVIGIDAKEGKVAIRGWEKSTKITSVELAKQMKELGVTTIIYTDIARDGMLSGPDFQYTEKLIKETGLEVIASGGISSMTDLFRLETIHAEGAILGKSIYERRIDLREAIAAFSE